jgi:methylmalonyl-CoA/ethylmalonyl-CoA epimerase
MPTPQSPPRPTGEPTTLDRFGLGPIDQIAYAVHDLEQSLPIYTALYGEFEVGVSPLSDCTFRGESIDCSLKLAVNRDGPVEIELIEVLEGRTPHSEFLEAHGEGLHHVRFGVDELDPTLRALDRAGYETIFYKRFGPTVGFAYVEAPREIGASLIELLELPR